jgi:NAD(P)H-hydrate epimerase
MMSNFTLSREAARELDRRAVDDYGMTGLVLMENAGRGVADRLCDLGINGPVAICCGAGNNGGDGFVVARHLDLRGHEVQVFLFADPGGLKGDAAANYRIIERSGLSLRQIVPEDLQAALSGASWIVDALLGTGARGEPRPPLARTIELMNAAGVPILAVDLPSGLDCDTGHAARNTIRAAHTCTFVAQKPGFLIPGAQPYLGTVHVVDIGAPRRLVEECLGRATMPKSTAIPQH